MRSSHGFIPTAVLIQIRNLLVATGGLVLLAIIGGIIFIIFNRPPAQNIAPSSAAAATQDAVIKPSVPSANAPEGAAVESITPTLAPGSVATIIIQTNPTSSCTITTDTAVVDKTALRTKIADEYGNVTWSWELAPTAPLGSHTATVTCAYHGRTAVVQGTFQSAQ